MAESLKKNIEPISQIIKLIIAILTNEHAFVWTNREFRDFKFTFADIKRSLYGRDSHRRVRRLPVKS